MTEASPLPAEARDWLRNVERRLHALPQKQRAETLAGLRDHLVELVAAGVSGPEAVSRLGSARDVAEVAFQQYQEQTGVDARERYLSAKRAVQLVALVLAVAAASALAVLPTYIEMSVTSDGAQSVRGATLVEANGLWAVFLLAVPVVVAALPLLARGRAWQPLSIASVVLLFGCVIVGFLSIGWYFLPAAIAAAVGAGLSPRPNTAARRSRRPAGGAPGVSSP